jgi:hypothetical protein
MNGTMMGAAFYASLDGDAANPQLGNFVTESAAFALANA